MLVVTTFYEMEAESLDIVRGAIIRQAEITRMREAGCQRFDVCFDPDSATRCLTYAIFESEAAYDHHLGSDHYRTFDDLVASRVQTRETELWTLVATARRMGVKEFP
ncbi:MAG TPA: antibiotic biosynthesis monooxygenase [Bauldia sp.]|nr:antibiotic biosynthesis monooxygenase [Bauldia sp.]